MFLLLVSTLHTLVVAWSVKLRQALRSSRTTFCEQSMHKMCIHKNDPFCVCNVRIYVFWKLKFILGEWVGLWLQILKHFVRTSSSGGGVVPGRGTAIGACTRCARKKKRGKGVCFSGVGADREKLAYGESIGEETLFTMLQWWYLHVPFWQYSLRAILAHLVQIPMAMTPPPPW